MQSHTITGVYVKDSKTSFILELVPPFLLRPHTYLMVMGHPKTWFILSPY